MTHFQDGDYAEFNEDNQTFGIKEGDLVRLINVGDNGYAKQVEFVRNTGTLQTDLPNLLTNWPLGWFRKATLPVGTRVRVTDRNDTASGTWSDQALDVVALPGSEPTLADAWRLGNSAPQGSINPFDEPEFGSVGVPCAATVKPDGTVELSFDLGDVDDDLENDTERDFSQSFRDAVSAATE